VLAADRETGLDLWAVDVPTLSASRVVDDLSPDATTAEAGLFAGAGGTLFGCDDDGRITDFGDGGPTVLAEPTDVDAVACGYDPGLLAIVVFDASWGIHALPQGTSTFVEWEPAPAGATILGGTVVVP
jgi:hypothetical protein